jgi:hypothetical protein
MVTFGEHHLVASKVVILSVYTHLFVGALDPVMERLDEEHRTLAWASGGPDVTELGYRQKKRAADLSVCSGQGRRRSVDFRFFRPTLNPSHNAVTRDYAVPSRLEAWFVELVMNISFTTSRRVWWWKLSGGCEGRRNGATAEAGRTARPLTGVASPSLLLGLASRSRLRTRPAALV